MTEPIWTFDPVVNAGYLKFRDEDVKKSEQLTTYSEGVAILLDTGFDGKPVGIEVIF